MLDAEDIQWHPYANLFPWIEGSAFDDLKADIKKNGVLEPVVFYEGKVLDGRNRFKAATELGIDFPSREYDGDDPLGFVISHNLTRRHLTDRERSDVAARLANLRKGANQHTPIGGPSIAEAAKIMDVSVKSVERSKTIQERGTVELQSAYEAGEVSQSAAAEVATLPKDEQSKLIAAGPKAVKAAAKRVRQSKSAAPKKAANTVAPALPIAAESPPTVPAVQSQGCAVAVIEPAQLSLVELLEQAVALVNGFTEPDKAAKQAIIEKGSVASTDALRRVGDWFTKFANAYDCIHDPKLSKAAIKAAFDEWWSLYPKKAGKVAAEKAFTSTVTAKRATIDELLDGLHRYREAKAGEDPKYTLNATTWLNGGHWGDEAISKGRFISQDSYIAGILSRIED